MASRQPPKRSQQSQFWINRMSSHWTQKGKRNILVPSSKEHERAARKTKAREKSNTEPAGLWPVIEAIVTSRVEYRKIHNSWRLLQNSLQRDSEGASISFKSKPAENIPLIFELNISPKDEWGNSSVECCHVYDSYAAVFGIIKITWAILFVL